MCGVCDKCICVSGYSTPSINFNRKPQYPFWSRASSQCASAVTPKRTQRWPCILKLQSVLKKHACDTCTLMQPPSGGHPGERISSQASLPPHQGLVQDLLTVHFRDNVLKQLFHDRDMPSVPVTHPLVMYNHITRLLNSCTSLSHCICAEPCVHAVHDA